VSSAIGTVTGSVLRPSRGDTNRVWRRVWSQSMMGVGSQVPIRYPSRSDFV